MLQRRGGDGRETSLLLQQVACASAGLAHEKGGCPARPCSPMHPRVLERTLWVVRGPGKARPKKFGFVALHHNHAPAPSAPGHQGQATRAAPMPISTTPIQPRRLSSSPSHHTPRTATSTTLSLSIGATRDTGPSFRAWK